MTRDEAMNFMLFNYGKTGFFDRWDELSEQVFIALHGRLPKEGEMEDLATTCYKKAFDLYY